MAGEYEVRYFGRDPKGVLARRKITVTAVKATLVSPTSALCGGKIEVKWTGPANQYDRIYVVKAGSPEKTRSDFSTPATENPARLTVPEAPGNYEVRYLTGQLALTLARAPLSVASVTASLQGPASVVQKRVTGGGAGEVIVDASGSMLQNLGTERRIDIAKRTLKNLTGNVIPPRTAFALRVFGREPNSCQTELEMASTSSASPSRTARRPLSSVNGRAPAAAQSFGGGSAPLALGPLRAHVEPLAELLAPRGRR